MAKSLIGWMVFQILVGIWLFISPYVLGFSGTRNADINSMVFGAVVILLGLGMSLFSDDVCGFEEVARKTR
jgi:hypothetical protein